MKKAISKNHYRYISRETFKMSRAGGGRALIFVLAINAPTGSAAIIFFFRFRRRSPRITRYTSNPTHRRYPSWETDASDFFLQIFMHKSAMQMHARELTGRSEVKPHQCQQCLKSFSSNHQLVQHIRVHTGEKPYKCSYCDRRFKQLSHVQQHTRLHTGEF